MNEGRRLRHPHRLHRLSPDRVVRVPDRPRLLRLDPGLDRRELLAQRHALGIEREWPTLFAGHHAVPRVSTVSALIEASQQRAGL